MPHHLQLVSDAKRAIDRVFGDTSVDRGTTRASLKEIRDEVDVKLDSLDSDDDASVAEDE
jgi:hypothetical protein